VWATWDIFGDLFFCSSFDTLWNGGSFFDNFEAEDVVAKTGYCRFGKILENFFHEKNKLKLKDYGEDTSL
jgi:hypothetical protein